MCQGQSKCKSVFMFWIKFSLLSPPIRLFKSIVPHSASSSLRWRVPLPNLTCLSIRTASCSLNHYSMSFDLSAVILVSILLKSRPIAKSGYRSGSINGSGNQHSSLCFSVIFWCAVSTSLQEFLVSSSCYFILLCDLK